MRRFVVQKTQSDRALSKPCRSCLKLKPSCRSSLPERLGRIIARVDVGAFHVLKTFDPPASALHGTTIVATHRFGKLSSTSRHQAHTLVVHLARAGWLALAR